MKTPSLVVAILLSVPLALPAQTPAPAKPAMPTNHPPIGGPQAKEAPSPWSELADYTITVKVPPKGDTGTWKFRTFEDPADVVLDFDTPGTKGRTRGTIMLVGGEAFATKGFSPEAGYEMDPLDAAVVNLKILTRLLGAAVPAGPSALKGKQAVNVREETAPIFASTPTANAQFKAPWSLKGTLERVDATTISYQLELDVPGADKGAERARWMFTGTAGGTTKERVLDNGTSLAGWTAYRLGPPKNAKQGHTALKFGATKLSGPVATVKDLRAAIK